MKVDIRESTKVLSESEGSAKKGRYRIQIIEGNRMGSSGYWPRDVIEADGPTMWGVGTHVYLDHLSESEEWDRPEGSVRNLAGVIDSVPVYEDASAQNGHSEGLYAEVQFFPMYHEMIGAIAPHVGMSIRALAEADYQEYDGNVVPVITKIVEGISVDVVTRAGAGGRILEAIESARPKIPKQLESKLLPVSAEESDERVIEMAGITEETALALADAMTKLTASLAASGEAEAAESKKTNKDDEQEPDQGVLFAQSLEAATKVSQSDLTESSKARVLDQIKAEGASADVDALIKAEAEYAEKILSESKKSSVGAVYVGESTAKRDISKIASAFPTR